MANILRFGAVILISLRLVSPSICAQKPGQNKEFNPEFVESVFRYQIIKCAENMSVAVFLLSVQGKDPSDEVMKRFADDAIRIRKRSMLGQSDATHEFIDKESGKFAVLLSVDKLKLIGEDRVEVSGSCGFADGAARGYKYSLVKEENGWIVKRAKPTWMW
jgi:hypothetical protein